MQNIVRRGFLYDPLAELRNELGWAISTNNGWRPAEDIVEADQDTTICLDVPGVSSQDLNIEFQDGMLQVSGHREDMKESSYGAVKRLERVSGSFFRSYRLPEGVESKQVQANLQDGVLELKFPKAEKSKPVEIPIGENITIEASKPTSKKALSKTTKKKS